MKYIFILLTLAMLGCNDPQPTTKYISTEKAVILKKNTTYTVGLTNYFVYLFNGSSADWYETNFNVYEKYNVGDTLNAVVITITKYERTQKDSINAANAGPTITGYYHDADFQRAEYYIKKYNTN